MQLTIEGGEVTFDMSRRLTSDKPLSSGQAAVLAYALAHGGTIRPVQAGVILHRNRPRHQRFRQWGDIESDGEPVACCRYASSDGVEVLKRLIKRGLMEKLGGGLYSLTAYERSAE